jgi:hypothetical protein
MPANSSMPEGTLSVFHVLHPSVVASTTGTPLESVASAQQSDAIGQDMSERLVRPLDVTVCVAQVPPPSVVDRIIPGFPKPKRDALEDRCADTDALATEARTAGRLSAARTAGAVTGKPPKGPPPTAQHAELEAQASPASGPVLDGRVWALQVEPSDVETTTPSPPVNPVPAARHCVLVVHDTAANGPVPLGRVCALHVVPPSVVPTTIPMSAPFPVMGVVPAAWQSELEVHDTAANGPVEVGRL